MKNIFFLIVGLMGGGYALLAGVAMPAFVWLQYGLPEVWVSFAENFVSFFFTYLLLFLSVFLVLHVLGSMPKERV